MQRLRIECISKTNKKSPPPLLKEKNKRKEKKHEHKNQKHKQKENTNKGTRKKTLKKTFFSPKNTFINYL